MSDLPDNYDPHDDLRAISDELMHTERAVFDTWIRVQHYILDLQTKIVDLTLRFDDARGDVP